MKATFFALLLVSLTTIPAIAQKGNPDAVLGSYWNPEKSARIEIFRDGDSLVGKIAWLKEPMKDVNNPDPELRGRDLLGVVFMRDFEFDGKNTWAGGEMYSPEHGKYVSAKLTLQKDGSLKIRGYIGSPLLGKTKIFTSAEGS